ncbi:MAG: lipopolysaccharide kinase InaA family protein [Opitutales bacterium]
MHPSKRALDIATEALKKDLSFLKAFDVDASKINQRSAVFERHFTNAGGEPIPVFVKVYTYRRHLLERLWRTGRARLETRNLLFFQQIVIPSAEVVAWGQRKNKFGKLIEEFIITRAVPDTLTLDKFVGQHCPDRNRPLYSNLRDQILTKLGQATAKIHQAHFFHKDLKWRNILASLNGEEVKLCWIDCPSGDFHPPPYPQTHGRLKDCATLDKIARFKCTKEERLHFVASYLKTSIGSDEVKAFAHAVSRYRRKRFDPMDDEQRHQTPDAAS